jgi:hypothetical protein
MAKSCVDWDLESIRKAHLAMVGLRNTETPSLILMHILFPRSFQKGPVCIMLGDIDTTAS